MIAAISLLLPGAYAACISKSSNDNHDMAAAHDRKPAPADRQRTDLPSTAGCTWDQEIRCWNCCSSPDYLAIACRAPGDCALFCSRKCLPVGYTQCTTWDPEPSGLCAGFKLDNNRPFSRCKITPFGCYSCGFCLGAGQAETRLLNPATGDCTCFATTCTPSWTQICTADGGLWRGTGG